MKEPTLLDIDERKLVGMRIRTSLSENRTRALWQSFKARVKEISNYQPGQFYSVQVFDSSISKANFTPTTLFEKWAAVEVKEEAEVPDGMESCVLPGGKYTVFLHKGPVHTFHVTLRHIHEVWLPRSGFELDERPHFEIMGDRYLGPDDPNSEEEVWIPVRDCSY